MHYTLERASDDDDRRTRRLNHHRHFEPLCNITVRDTIISVHHANPVATLSRSSFTTRDADSLIAVSATKLPPLLPFLRGYEASYLASSNALARAKRTATVSQRCTVRRRCRISSGPNKLPRMSGSERGKYYRQKHKEYEDELDTAVADLTAQVRDLELLNRLRRELITARYRGSTAARVLRIAMQALSSGSLPPLPTLLPPAPRKTRSAVSLGPHSRTATSLSSPPQIPPDDGRPPRLRELLGELLPLHDTNDTSDAPPAQSASFASRFEMRGFQLLATACAPMIALRGDLVTVHPADGRRRVRCPATLRIYLDADGRVQQRDLETDVVCDLQSVLPSLGDVDLALRGARGDQSASSV